MTLYRDDNILSPNGKPPFVQLDVELWQSQLTMIITACIVQNGRRGINLLKDHQYTLVDSAMRDIRAALEGTYCKLVVFSGDVK